MITNGPVRRKRRRLVASALALTIGSSVALVACGNTPDTNTVAKHLPENTIGLVSAAISPSAKQQLSLFKLSKHFPDKVQTDKAEDVRDKLIAEILDDSSLNYDADVKPWLGAEAAMAVLPSKGDDKQPILVAALKQTDKDKATAALEKAKVDAKTYRFIGDYVYFLDEAQVTDSNATKALDDIQSVNDGKAKALQDNARYKKNIDSLHGEHLVIGWFDLPVLAKEGIEAARISAKEAAAGSSAFESFSDVGTTLSSTGVAYQRNTALGQALTPAFTDAGSAAALGTLGGLSTLLGGDAEKTQEDAYKKIQESADEVGSFSFELYATSNSLVMQGVTEKEPKDTGDKTDRKLFNSLPDDTLGAFSISGTGKGFNDLLTAMEKDQTGDQSAYNEFKPILHKLADSLGNETVGFMHNGDPLSGGAVMDVKDTAGAQSAIDDLMAKVKDTGLVSVKDHSVSGGKGYDLQQVSAGESTYDFDPDTGEIVIKDAPSTASGPHIYIGIANNRMAITNNDDRLKAALAGSGALGSTDPVKKALDTDQELVFGSFYVNIDQAVALAEKHGNKATGDDGDWLKSMDVMGSQSWTADGHYYVEVRLGMKEAK